MVSIAVMQPYLFPYLNYFRLINRSDYFVFLNDVSFPKKKFVNRNSFKFNGILEWNLPLAKISQNKLISEHHIFDFDHNKKILINKFNSYFKHAKYYDENKFLLDEFLIIEDDQIDLFNFKAIKIISNYLNLNVVYKFSNETQLLSKGENKIIDICKYFNANIYRNLPGGVGLYNKSNFTKENIKLEFLDEIDNDSSILDYLFNFGKDKTIELINLP